MQLTERLSSVHHQNQVINDNLPNTTATIYGVASKQKYPSTPRIQDSRSPSHLQSTMEKETRPKITTAEGEIEKQSNHGGNKTQEAEGREHETGNRKPDKQQEVEYTGEEGGMGGVGERYL